MRWWNRYWQHSFQSGWERIFLHVSFWILFTFFMRMDSRTVFIRPDLPFWITASGVLIHLFLFYPLVYGLVPLLMRRQWFWAVAGFIPYFIIAVLIKAYHMTAYSQWVNPGHIIQGDGDLLWKDVIQSGYNWLTGAGALLSTLVYLLSEIFIPLWIKIIRNAYRSAEKRSALIRQNARLQLEQLRSQINPHLFFNTLNNLQSFIVQEDKTNASALLNELSAFMRISLYQIDKEWISLEKELTLINHYIAIERIRFDHRATISINIVSQNSSLEVPPLLFLPFVENAFKYSSEIPAGQVDICIDLSVKDNNIHFRCVNHYAAAMRSGSGGIGLENVRRRLDHYYPQRHTLQTSHQENNFLVDLIIMAA